LGFWFWLSVQWQSRPTAHYDTMLHFCIRAIWSRTSLHAHQCLFPDCLRTRSQQRMRSGHWPCPLGARSLLEVGDSYLHAPHAEAISHQVLTSVKCEHLQLTTRHASALLQLFGAVFVVVLSDYFTTPASMLPDYNTVRCSGQFVHSYIRESLHP
jgi:hypothetical protein